MKQGKRFLILILAVLLSVSSDISLSKAEEIEPSDKDQVETLLIEIEKVQEIEHAVLEYPVGTTEEEVKDGLPDTLVGYDSGGNSYEIAFSWKAESSYTSDAAGEVLYLAEPVDEQYSFLCDLPKLTVCFVEEQEEQENISDDTSTFQIRVGEEDAPSNLRINLLSAPFGVTKDKLSFSWENSLKENMVKQSAYRIVISSRNVQVETREYVYDSGWQEDTRNTSVQLDLSEVLLDNELYYWQVQIRNEQGEESSLSLPQAFATSVEDEWISQQGIWGSDGEKVVFLRTEFSIPENVEKAVLNVTALDGTKSSQFVYNMYINETEIGLGPNRPDGKILDYDTYDVTQYLQTGENVLGAISYSENNAAFLCQMTIYLSDGTKQILINSGRDRKNWKVLDGDPVYVGNNNSSIGTSYYTAIRDNLDAVRYPEGWMKAGFGLSGWITPTTNNRFDNYTLRPSQNDGYKRWEVEPYSVQKKADGSYLIDFGKEIIGSIRLNLNSNGGNITLQYGEQLDDKGNAKYQMATGNVYEETWRLRSGQQTLSGIGMKTFRYVTVRNCPVSLSVSQVKGLAVRNAFEDDDSSFSSSNEVLNQVYEMSKYTSKMTTQGMYVDTQSRERLPYEGDNLISGMLSFSFSPTSTAFKYTSEYLLSHTTWPAEYSLYNIMAVYQHYLYTGDIRMLEQSYQALKGKTFEELFDSGQGLMGKSHDERPKIMVDWPTSETDDYNMEDSYYNTVFNAVCAGGYEDMASIAGALGHQDEQEYYQNLADTIRTNMIQKLYDRGTGRFYDGMTESGKIVSHSAQHATAFALAYRIYDSKEMSDAMAASIESDEAMEMSVYGSYFLLQGLYESDHGTLARKVMSNPENIEGVKSWTYMMNGLGATISSEAWNYPTKSNTSLSHAWGAAPGSMLTKGMFGIQPTSPGYDTFQVKLQPGGVRTAAVKVPTMKGSIEVSYSIQSNGDVQCNILVPSNTSASVYIPVENGIGTIMVDGEQYNNTLQDKEGYIGCVLEPGQHNMTVQAGVSEDTSEWLKTDVVTDTYSSGRWCGEKTNYLRQGDIYGENLEAVRFRIRNAKVSGSIEYQTYMQSYGWQDTGANNAVNGIPEGGKRMEAIKVNLTGELASQYNIFYRVFTDKWGWLDWAQNGEPAGSAGYAEGIRAFEIQLLKKGEAAPGDRNKPYYSTEYSLNYSTHVQSYGWQPEVGDGDISGTTGEKKRLEAIKIRANLQNVSGDVMYSTHVQSYGWLDWVKNGELSGTEGQAKRLEAIKIKLTGDLAENYDIYYRVHAQSYGWLGWAKNGEEAGTEGMAKRLEAIQIRLVKKGDSAPGTMEGAFITPKISYRTHVQTYGWQSNVYDGEISGTEGQAKRLEGIRINLYKPEYSGDIEYATHVQSYGWLDWVKNGALSGTEGQAKRLEAIKIRLTGNLAENYDIYYRVHAQSYGWLDWAKNGEEAGTEGLAKRLEAIQIQLVEKGKEAPGATNNSFIKPEITYQTHVQTYGWQGLACDGATSGTEGKAKRLEAIRINLHNPEMPGSIEYTTHVQTYGWMNWVKDGALSGTEGQAKRLEAIKIKLTGDLAENYDVYYRVHAETYGWLGWAKNGEEAGTEGQAKRLEAIQIMLVEKDGQAPGGTEEAFVKTIQ